MRLNTRFFRWFRVLPLMVVIALGVGSYSLSYAPVAVLRTYFLPIHHKAAILDSAERHGVDPLLVCAIIECESGWDESAESGVGAQGLMQVMPSTAELMASAGFVDGDDYDYTDLSDPITNIEYGCATLSYLQDNLQTRDQVIAAYNAGLGAVQDWLAAGATDVASAITYPETRVYLQRVNEAFRVYSGLYDEQLNER